MKQVTLKLLNKNDNPRAYGGELLSDDGEDQLWLFKSIDKVANRFLDDGLVEWSNDVEDWGYKLSDALE